jgi:hypothetical protein
MKNQKVTVKNERLEFLNFQITYHEKRIETLKKMLEIEMKN